MQLLKRVEIGKVITLYIQVFDEGRACISLTTGGLNHDTTQWLTTTELKEIKKAITEILKESKQ